MWEVSLAAIAASAACANRKPILAGMVTVRVDIGRRESSVLNVSSMWTEVGVVGLASTGTRSHVSNRVALVC